MSTADDRHDVHDPRDEAQTHLDGGGIETVRLETAVIRIMHVGPMDNCAYLVTDRTTGSQLLIDAAAEPDRLMALVRAGADAGRLDLIITTHRHHDHIGALAAVARETGARTAAGAEDARAIAEQTGVEADETLRDGDTIRVGDVELEAIALRGHTPGSIALLLRDPEGDHLFTGDSLFPGGVGNTDHDPARFSRLLTDVRERVFDRLDDATVVHPGHGAGTTLGAERPHLEEWRERGW